MRLRASFSFPNSSFLSAPASTERSPFANLSITTVSRALDGYDDVAETTRQLVVKTAQEMGYIPNQAARQLRRRRTDTIGYILPADKPRFSDPFFAEFIAGLGDEASANGFDLLVSTAPPGSQSEQLAYFKWVHGRKVDGIVLNRIRQSDWRVQYLEQSQFLFATMERLHGSQNNLAIDMNGRYWFGVLVDHLASLGHRRIAYIGTSPGLIIQQDRYQGYLDGLERQGLALAAGVLTTAMPDRNTGSWRRPHDSTIRREGRFVADTSS